jgi:integrase/recombinase XerD
MPNSSALIDAFCDQVWLQDGLAASSLGSYRRDLIAWARWLEDDKTKPAKGLLPPPAAIRGLPRRAILTAKSPINRRLSSCAAGSPAAVAGHAR